MTPKPPFERIVGDHGPAVLRLCRSLLVGHDAEDAWSEAFLAALRDYPALPAEANVEAWLITIARRKVVDVFRARARRAVPHADLPDGESRVGVWQPANDALWSALRALPDRQRLAVGYHYVAGLAYAEVAAIIGGSADAVRRAAYDGITRLRQTYPSVEEEP